MEINSTETVGSNNDENSDEDGPRGSNRARQLMTNIENNADLWEYPAPAHYHQKILQRRTEALVKQMLPGPRMWVKVWQREKGKVERRHIQV